MPELGELYVKTDEDGNAVSVGMNGGEPGKWRGISIARMALPDEHKTQDQLNDLAKVFAAAPQLREALIAMHTAVKHDPDFQNRKKFLDLGIQVVKALNSAGAHI